MYIYIYINQRGPNACKSGPNGFSIDKPPLSYTKA